MKLFTALMACVGCLFSGCSERENMESPAVWNKVVLTGSAETKKISRSALSDQGEFKWLEGDKIDVYASDGQFYEFVLSDGAGTNAGEFSAELVEGTVVEKYAVSPAGLSPEIDTDGSLLLTLPLEYTWQPGQTNALMLSEVKDGKLSFKNLGGLVKFSVNNISKGCRIVVSSSTHILYGTMKVTKDSEGNNILKGSNGGVNNVVTITSESTLNKQAFYLPLPVVDGIKLNVKVYDGTDDTPKLEKNTTLNIRRKQLVLMPTLTLPETANAVVKDVSSSDAVNEALQNAVESKEVLITVNSNTGSDDNASSTVEVSDPIVIPETITTSLDASVNITFDEVPVAASDSKIVLTDNQETENSESISNVTIAIPEVTEDVEAPSFEINLPTTTVTLSATQETASFGTVWATTADNTLIVDEGVVVEELVAMKGSIAVSGIVKNLSRGKGHKYGERKVKVIIRKGGKVILADENIELISESEREVSTLEELVDATWDETVNSIILTKPIVLDESINLFGKTLKISESFFEDNETADAAITVAGSETICIQGNSGKIQGGTWVPSKYLIKALSACDLYNVELTSWNNLLGVKVENTNCSLLNSSIITEFNQALGVWSDTNMASVYLWKNSTINGMIYVNNEYDSTVSDTQRPTSFNLENGQISGQFIVGGSKSGLFSFYLNEEGTIYSDLSYEEEGLTPIEFINNGGTIYGAGWDAEGTDDEEEKPNYGIQAFDGTVTCYEELVEALKYYTATIRVEKDFDITGQLVLNGDAHIYLQGHTLTVAEGISDVTSIILNNNNCLFLYDGNLVGANQCGAKYFIENNSKDGWFCSLDLFGVNIKANGIYAAVAVNGSRCIVADYEEENIPSSIDATMAFVGDNSTITIWNGTITGDFTLQNGTTSIYSGVINGNLDTSYDYGVIDINVHGVTVNGTGWPIEVEEVEYVTIENVSFSIALKAYFGEDVTLDENGYAVMTQEFADNVRRLYLFEVPNEAANIESLSGIEKFANLEDVFFPEEHKVLEADFTKNPELRSIMISNLSSINVAGLSKLEVLSCGGNNNLTQVNLEGCTSLIQLGLSQTGITSLNVEIPSKIVSLSIQDVKIEILDLSEFTSLKSLGAGGGASLKSAILPAEAPFERLTIPGVPLASLDVSRYKDLKELYCGGCGLTSLTIGSCNLTTLYCDANNLKTLDLSSCTNLTKLQCGNQGYDNLEIVLTLPSSLIEKWNTSWSSDPSNGGVVLAQ